MSERTKAMRQLLFTLTLFLLAGSAVAQRRCAVPGELIHWQADFCMSKEQTDDFEQAGVQRCLRREMKKEQKNACAAKTRYKKAMCSMAAQHPPYNGSSRKCFEDPSFSGPTVRNGGV